MNWIWNRPFWMIKALEFPKNYWVSCTYMCIVYVYSFCVVDIKLVTIKSTIVCNFNEQIIKLSLLEPTIILLLCIYIRRQSDRVVFCGIFEVSPENQSLNMLHLWFPRKARKFSEFFGNLENFCWFLEIFEFLWKLLFSYRR